MKTYCPYCGALNVHGLTKPVNCEKCHQSLELNVVVSTSTPVKKPSYTPQKASQARKARPQIISRNDFEEDDGEEDAEIPENISKIEIEAPRISGRQRQTIRDIAGKKDSSDFPREITRISKKKQLEQLRNESRSARENPPQDIE